MSQAECRPRLLPRLFQGLGAIRTLGCGSEVSWNGIFKVRMESRAPTALRLGFSPPWVKGGLLGLLPSALSPRMLCVASE